MKVFSEDWSKAYVNALNANKNYKEAASWWTGDFVFVVEPSGNLKKVINMFIGLTHGNCTGAAILKEGEKYEVLPPNAPAVPLKPGQPVKAEFIFSGPYDNWVKVLKKELDPIQGLMAGKFKLVGNMAKVMRATRAAQEMVNSTTVIKGVDFY